jgi:hypothetical protein
MNFDSETFGFYDGNTKVKHLGGLMTFGVVDRYYGAPYLYRPDDWKEAKPQGQWRKILVEVPSDKKELVLKMTQLVYDEANREAPPKKTPYSAPVKLTGEPKPYNINDYVEIAVRGVKMLDFLEDKNEYDRNAPVRKIVNEGGSIMQLTVQITPKQHNNVEEKGFYWSPGVFGLSFGRGGRSVCMGSRNYGSISAHSGEAIQQADGDIWNSKTVAIFFPVPSNLRTFEVTYMGQKVSAGEVK